ncbi:hypothetical protein GP486_005860 [Trichoglossum hirsutum]|uniref:CNH domain-containing protein n=1 Tax=Trichoglossum hirsutum TaxID=265104 RepID=A0A9P8L8E0_9PEZI|nr:hypothetical protein GP486_005860 [Trichoglossum hirsutum]
MASVSRKRKRSSGTEAGPYVLQSLADDLPLATESDDTSEVEITCVEFWEDNLYVGTSAAEILHFVLIPPEPSDSSSRPSPILAFRYRPPFTLSSLPHAQPGIQQILLLPKVNKACVLCNGTLTFYSLPELSPVFARVANCSWVGGADLDTDGENGARDDGVVIMILVKNKIRLVRVTEEVRVVKDIGFPSSTLSIRRSNFACVATAHAYALLDVNQSRKIPLFPISSLDDNAGVAVGGEAEDISSTSGPAISRRVSSAHPSQGGARIDDRGHGRSTSLGTFVGGLGRQQESPNPSSRLRSGLETPDRGGASSPALAVSPERPTERGTSPAKGTISPDKPLPPPPAVEGGAEASKPGKTTTPQAVLLEPHIVSPTPTEFLLTTGTGLSDPGVGIFVNLDGDVSRGTLEFEKYPERLVIDGQGLQTSSESDPHGDGGEGYVLAVMERDMKLGGGRGIEIQRWDSENESQKEWVEIIPASARTEGVTGQPVLKKLGLRKVAGHGEISIAEVGDKLRLVRLRLGGASGGDSPVSVDSSDSRTKASVERVTREMELFESRTLESDKEEPLEKGWEAAKNKQEEEISRRFGKLQSRIVTWSGNRIWWVVRNPLVIRLDSRLEVARPVEMEGRNGSQLDRSQVITVLNSIRGLELRTGTGPLSLSYIREKAGLLLFTSLVAASYAGTAITQVDKRVTEDALLDNSIDPRVVLAAIPMLREEVLEGPRGIWVFGGVKEIYEHSSLNIHAVRDNIQSGEGLDPEILGIVKRYLIAWRRKKGYGSVSVEDEKEAFRTVDAALLRVLLVLDKNPVGQGLASPVRAELYDLVDKSADKGGIDCFDRAVALLEGFGRLYVLSRLYQSRKLFKDVLGTWKRIIEGERNDRGEFVDGETEVRKYLVRIKDTALVKEYGAWLARRNPGLGVQVFADDKSRVKLEPAQVVEILKEKAPDAVKEYLEYLVFGKDNAQYANDLITFYLDTVLTKLSTSEAARDHMFQTYETYRALKSPKPTYQQFITENAIAEEWWRNRLRLLQLLGRTHGAASAYDVSAILRRLSPYENQLVPEMIILDGRQGRHEQALRLLTHGLGDYDTAINYCLLGGTSIFHPSTGTFTKEAGIAREDQAALFGYLLTEFLSIDDVSVRVEQTGGLLERFGGWFDVGYVLSVIPDSWSIELLSGFIVSALRRLVREKSETMVAKALSGAENLRINADFVSRCDEVGPSMELPD